MEGIASLIATGVSFLAVVVSVITLINSHKLKSYEFMIKHRLETFDALQNRCIRLKSMVSPEYIDHVRQEMTLAEYAQVLTSLIGELEVLFSRSERQEYFLLKECALLKKTALTYFEAPASDTKADLLTQEDVTFMLADIYLWSLWQYLQQLYKKNKTTMVKLFEREFRNSYENARKNGEMDGTVSAFFEKYSVDLFLPGEDWKTEDICKGKLWRFFHPVSEDK